MGTLNITHDTYYGWPYQGAIVDNARPKNDENIEAGMFIEKEVSSGEVVKATGATTYVFFALTHQSALSMTQSESMPYIVKNAIMCTTQFTGDSSTFLPGTDLEIDAAHPGKVRVKASGSKVCVCDGVITRHGKTMIKVVI